MEISSQKAIETVNAPPRFAVYRAGKREGVVTVTEAERSILPPKKLVRQLVFTEFGWSRVTTLPASLKDEVSPVKLSPKVYIPRPSLITPPKTETPVAELQDDVESKSGTPDGPKQCRCKQSKCLKLYCECFAAGAYCNGCNCSRCHNKVENEDLRKAAVEIILERNPHAFRPKIATSPQSPLYNGDEAGSTPLVGRHNRGCNCKRTECLKKYCECFRANVFCSENCKCADCKNSEGHKKKITKMVAKIYKNSIGCQEKMAISERGDDNLKICQNFKEFEGKTTSSSQQSINVKLYSQLINTVLSEALVLLDHGFFKERESRKRKVKELPSIEEHISKHRLAEYQQMSTVGVSGPLSDSIVDAMVSNNSSTSLRHPYRPSLADLIHPDRSRKLCSGLLMLAEAANVLAGKVGKLDLQGKIETKESDAVDAQNKENHHGRTLPSGTIAAICHESATAFMEAASVCENLRHDWDHVLAEQERRVLTSFKCCLETLIKTYTEKNGKEKE